MTIKNLKRLLELYTFSFHSRVYTLLKMWILPLKEFSEYSPHYGLFVDVGTGYGYMANFIALESADRNVIGVDIDSKRISVAKRTIDGRVNIDFVCGDIRELRDIDNVDVFMMADVLHHIPSDSHKDFLKCLYNRLREGGTFIIRENNKKHTLRYYFINWLSEALFYLFSEKFNFYTAEQLRTLLEQAGFKITKKILSSPCFVYEIVIYVCKK